MKVNIFLLCFNECTLLPHTITHYKKYLPNCNITIYDNESTDDSVNIAKNLGCNIISWNSNNEINDHKYREIKNNCWKNVEDGWVIVADMDEWLCVTEEDLRNEEEKGTTILTVKGYDMMGESQSIDLTDIDLHSINKGFAFWVLNKRLCFLKNKVKEINYDHGCHTSNPLGEIQYSLQKYINKHMSNLGLPFLIDKMKKRYERSTNMRIQGMATHYTNDIEIITHRYNDFFNKSEIISTD